MSFKSFDELRAACRDLPAGSEVAAAAVARRQDTLTKPQGSLGRWKPLPPGWHAGRAATCPGSTG